MKKSLVLFILISSISIAQNIKDYEYVFVPEKFSIFKENDKFRLNTNVKLLLQKYGFKSYTKTDSVPFEIANENCNKLYADLEKDNNFFVTKIKIILKDCYDKIVFQTDFGSSKEKELLVAYNQALREAALSFDKLNYKFKPKATAQADAKTSNKIQESNTISTDVPPSNPTPVPLEVFYFAQPTTFGFQVIDTEPKVIMRLYTTSQKNIFIAQKGTVNGVVLQKNNQWVFEYLENSKVISEVVPLKF
jgi:hypothetical protein